MLRSDELKAQLEEVKAKADTLIKADEINAAIEEIKGLKAKITLAEMEEADAKNSIPDGGAPIVITNEPVDKVKASANLIRAAIKQKLGKPLTEAENALIISGTSGENIILPQTITTLIEKLIRQYRSLRDVVGYLAAPTLTGTFPIENFTTVTGLVAFTEDGTNTLSEATDIKFTSKSWSLKEYGAFVALSNTLLQMTDNDLINYVAQVFARKAVFTENSLLVAALNNGKTVKALADWKALKKSINRDLDPAALSKMVIVTNQNGFDYLDSALDAYGRPVLQTDPTQPTKKLFMGYRVEVYPNTMLPDIGSTAGSIKSPFYFGDLEDAVKLVDHGQYLFATSTEAGFLKNMTYAKVITFYDTISVDNSDACYIAATMITG